MGAGFVPITLGTDTAGSIRNPGGICGGVGLKPTNELLPMRGIFPVAYTLGTDFKPGQRKPLDSMVHWNTW